MEKNCSACLGDLNFDTCGKIEVNNYAYNYYLGYYEGILLALYSIMKNDNKWNTFKEILVKIIKSRR
jgi:predicted amidophosphoribosyltransferase